MVRFLVGEKSGVKACLAESCDDASFPVYTVIVVGIGSRKQHRHALVCGVRFCEHVVECRQSRLAGHERRGVALVTIDAEVGGASRLAYYKYIHLVAVGGVGGLSFEGESG